MRGLGNKKVKKSEGGSSRRIGKQKGEKGRAIPLEKWKNKRKGE